MKVEYYKEYSHILNRDMEFKVYGHSGQPILVFPCQDGRFYDFENFMTDIYKIDLITFAKNILIYYGVTVVSYSLLTYAVCTYRYSKAKNSLKCYYHNLKKLGSLYGGDNASKKPAGGRK